MKMKISLVFFLFFLLFSISNVYAMDSTMNVTADTYVSDKYSNTNYGTSTVLVVAANESDLRRVFTLFNLSNMEANKIMLSAKLMLYITAAPYKTGANETTLPVVRAYRAYNTTTGYNETNITYNNEPDQDTMQDNVTIFTTPGVWISWDVTEAAKSAYNSSSKLLSIMVRDDDQNVESNETLTSNFTSKEYDPDFQPYLKITYSSVEGITSVFLLGLTTLLSDVKGMVMLSLTTLSYGLAYFTRHEELILYVFTIIIFILATLNITPTGLGYVIGLNSLCMAISMSKSKVEPVIGND